MEPLMQQLMQQLKGRLAEISHLQQAGALLSWDEQTYMPPAGAQPRGQVKATLSKLAHEKLTDPEIGRLLEKAEAEAAHLPPDSDEAALLRLVRRDYDKAVKIPSRLAAELAEASSQGYQAWMQAREAADFGLFRDALARLLELQRQVVDALGYQDHPYDALLDHYEPGMTTAETTRLFEELRAHLVPLVREVAARVDAVDDSFLKQPFPEGEQWELTEEALRLMGFDFRRGRQDRSVHPFCTSFTPWDVRVTTRIDPGHFSPGFFASLHEGGHALYEQGLPVEHAHTPLGNAVSLGVHESQSRLWENLVGRSEGFWRFFMPVVQKYFPGQLGRVSPEQMYRAVNKSRPSLIRVEADELTYNLHIMLRFDLEKELVEGTLDPARLPTRWAEKMEEYVGLVPPDDTRGVLQDVHWAYGLFGYFPTYTLGNLLAVQLYRAAVRAHPSIPEGVASGDFSALLAWLRENVHRHGSRYMPKELVERATGEALRAQPFIDYVTEKYGKIYGLPGSAP